MHRAKKFLYKITWHAFTFNKPLRSCGVARCNVVFDDFLWLVWFVYGTILHIEYKIYIKKMLEGLFIVSYALIALNRC